MIEIQTQTLAEATSGRDRRQDDRVPGLFDAFRAGALQKQRPAVSKKRSNTFSSERRTTSSVRATVPPHWSGQSVLNAGRAATEEATTIL